MRSMKSILWFVQAGLPCGSTLTPVAVGHIAKYIYRGFSRPTGRLDYTFGPSPYYLRWSTVPQLHDMYRSKAVQG